MNTDQQNPFSFPPPGFGFGQVHPREQQAQCYLCDTVIAVRLMAAIPVGYFRHSIDIAPTWTENGTVQARAMLAPGFPRNFRPPSLTGAPYICEPCWKTCCQTDNVAQGSEIPFGSPWDEPPMMQQPPF
jgi:hypothetical protein